MHHSVNLTQGPLPDLIRKIALPASTGFFFNTMFNVVDTWYAGQFSTEALAALSVSFPIFFLIIAIAVGMSTGTTALISNTLGEENPVKAKHYAYQSLSMAIFNGLIFTPLGMYITPFLLRLMNARGIYLQYASEYMNVIVAGSVFFFINNVLNSILSSHGDTRSFRNFLFLGFLLNIALDPWFMFGGFGLPAFGIKGVAISTVIIQIIGAFYLWHRIKNQEMLDFPQKKDLLPNKHLFSEIFGQGFPASLNMLTIAIGIFVITYFAGKFGKEAVAAYGIATRIEQIILLPTIGLNISSLALSGQNFGAKHLTRVKKVWHLNLQYGLLIMTAGVIIVLLFPEWLIKIFTNDSAVIVIGLQYLRIAVWGFWAYVFLNVSISVLQGIKKPRYAVYIGIYRQAAAAIPIFWILAFVLQIGISGIWYGILIVNWSAAFFTIFYTKLQLAKAKKLIP